MNFKLPELAYATDALEPYISEETLEFHYGKHHKAYVEKLNKLIKDSQFENMPLEEVIMTSTGDIFNNAAQHWNHSFFWKCLSPDGGGEATGKIKELILKEWHTFALFKEAFENSATSNFGSGWTWLVQEKDGSLNIMNTKDANSPITSDCKALLTLDVWEHAYYLDYKNERPKFVSAFWSLVNWDFVNSNIK